MLINQSDNVRGASNEYFQLEVPVEARYLRIINLHCTTGKFSLSGLRAFGKIDKSLPAEVHGLIAETSSERPPQSIIVLEQGGGSNEI